MKKDWTTTKLIAVGSLATLRFLFKLLSYTPLLISSGSVFSGIIIEIVAPFFLVLSALLFKQFGSVTIFTIFSFIIEIPLPVMFPLPINFAARFAEALSVDSLYLVCKSKKLFSFLGGFIATLIDLSVAIALVFSIGLFNVSNIPKFLLSPLVIVVLTILISLLGGLSGIFALFIYGKLKNTSVIQRIQGQ